MSSQNPSQTYPMPSPSVSTFTFPSTTEPVFSASTSEPVFESPNHTQTSQTTQSQQLQQYHTTTVSNNNAKFPYLKKEEYETWAMKMEYWIMNSDHNLWNIVLNGNSRKRTGRDPKGNIMILPPVSVEEQIAVQRETKARTILLQSLPEDHMADFHHLDDARDIWLAVKARFGGNDESKKMRKSMLKQEFSEFRVSESEGLHKGYDRFQKILSQLNQMQAKPDNEDCNMKFLRALPPSWSQVAITLKTKGGLDYLSFDDLKLSRSQVEEQPSRVEKKSGPQDSRVTISVLSFGILSIGLSSTKNHLRCHATSKRTALEALLNTLYRTTNPKDTINFANEDNADFINNEDDVVAHVLDDDDVVVSDDDEVNPSTNVEEMACVAPRSHGADAGGSPPRRPNRPVPAQCQSSMLRLETGNASLRKAFRENNKQPLQLGFDYADLGTFHPLGNFASMLNSLMGETVRPLPLACEWEEIPEAFKAHIYPTLESYFNLAEWYNNQDKVVVGSNVYTVGERVRLGLELKLRLLWRKNKNRIKADHYTKHDSPDEAKNHPPPPRVWGDRTQDEWNELVDWWSHPNRVSRSLQNAANRAKNTILTHQGKKSFAQGRNEYKVEKGHYEDLIETWRKGHSSKKTGEFKTEQNKQRYLDMKAMQDRIKAGIIPFKTDQEILDEVVPSDNRQNMSGIGRKLPGGGSTSRRRTHRAYGDVMNRDQMTQILRQQEQEKELYRKQAEEAQQRAYLASLKADQADQRANVAYQNTESIYEALGQFFMHYNSPNSARPFTPPAFSLVPPPPPGPSMPQLTPNWAHLLQPPLPYNQPLQPLQPPYPGPFPPLPVTNNTFNNCYQPVLNSTLASTSNTQAQHPHYTLLTNPHMNDSRSCDQLAQDLAREKNNECSSGEEEEEEEGEQQSGDDYSSEEEE
ncbi:ribonuclease H-like domain-containing protein [Tanacetum coccineum]